MAPTTASRCYVAITLSGWCVAFLVIMYGAINPDSMVKYKWTAPSLGCKQMDVAQDTGKVFMSRQADCQDCIRSRFLLFQEMVRTLEDKLLTLEDEPRQNFSRLCSEEFTQACTSKCSQPLSPSIADRLYEPILSPNLTLTEDQRQAVLSIAESVPESDVIFLSAASSNHFAEVQAMYQNLHTKIFPHMNNYTAIMVDLGLTEKERHLAEKNCQCRVINFPTHKFPPHCANNHCYAWKPLIVRAIIEKARKNLVYMDASIRWRDYGKFSQVLSATKQKGLQLFRFDTSTRIPLHTLKQTFDYFGWEPCAFDNFPELQGNIALYQKQQFIIKTVLEPWARCALEPSCICPVEPRKVISCGGKVRNHMCHRFDQTVLTIVAARAFNKDMPKFIRSQTNYNGGKGNYMDVKRGHKMSTYFSRS